MRESFLPTLRDALALDFPYPFRPLTSGREAAVLLLVSWSEKGNEIEILITRRTESVETHKGQYAFPGGVKDAEDKDLSETAIRETEEEVGISRQEIEILGELPRIWTPSGFLIHPWVGLTRKQHEKIEIRVSADEIDTTFWVKLSEFGREGVYSQEWREFMGRRVPMDVYQIGSHRIWGATAAILKNFIGRIEKVGLK